MSCTVMYVHPISVHSLDEEYGLLILAGDSFSASGAFGAHQGFRFPSWFAIGLYFKFGGVQIFDRPVSEAFYLNGKFYYRETLDGQRGLASRRKVGGISRLILEVNPVVDAEHVSIINEALARELRAAKAAADVHPVSIHSIDESEFYSSKTFRSKELLFWTQCSSIFRPVEMERFVGPANKQAS